ncbi:hypothetical protein Q8V11_000807 [Salmonella enterica]|nr:hypothetical protein [Salmonella enterica]
MSNTFSRKNNAGELERWFLKISISKGQQPLPNMTDIGINSLQVNYCLWSKKEYDEQFPVPLKIDKIYNLEKNTKLYPSEGAFPWVISAEESNPWKVQISEEEFDNANYLMVWAGPIGSAAFFDSDSSYWKGVLRINISSSKKVEEENNSNNINHIIEVNLNIAQSVISYFIDLVQEFSTNNYKELKKIHDDLAQGQLSALGKLGVMGPSLERNDDCLDAGKIDNFEAFRHNKFGFGVDLYDYQYYEEQRRKVFGPDGNCIDISSDIPYTSYSDINGGFSHTKYYNNTVGWNQSGSAISIYDFKTPIKKLYAEMIRIGNDGRIYSNEGFSNINWGIIGRQLNLEKGDTNYFATLDPFSSNEPHDELATDIGYEIADTVADEFSEFPAVLDRRAVFLLVLKSIRENDYFTYLGAECAKTLGRVRYSEICNSIKNKSEKERISYLMEWKDKWLNNKQ